MKPDRALTDDEKNKCWSMLMNLNDEAIIYEVQYQAYDNRDEIIAKRLGLKVLQVRQYLKFKSINHLKKINERIEKRIRRSTSTN